MTGADIATDLLRADPDVTALVATANIKLGRLTEKAPLPALLVRTVSSVDRSPLKPGATRHVVERVSVTVRAASYRDQVEIIRLIRSCCNGLVIDLGAGRRAIVRNAGKGPDLGGPGGTFEQAADLRVSFEEPS